MHVDIHLVHKHALVYVMIVRDYIVVWCVAIVFLIITIWRKTTTVSFFIRFRNLAARCFNSRFYRRRYLYIKSSF